MASPYLMIAPPDVESRNDAAPVFEPGGLFWSPATRRWYRYVQLVDATTARVGQAALWADDNLAQNRLVQVTAQDVSSSGGLTADGNCVAGIFVNQISQNCWGFIATGGVVTCHFVGRTVGAAGLPVWATGGGNSGTTSNLNVGTAGTAPGFRWVGVTLEAKNSSTHLARCLIWLDGD